MESNKTRIVPCPTCGKMVSFEKNPFRPFCSRGCKGADFLNWTDQSYRIMKDDQEDSTGSEQGE